MQCRSIKEVLWEGSEELPSGRLFELLDHNLVTAVASDAHSPYQRTPWMQDVYQSLLEEYPRDYLEALFTENPGRICRGQEVIRFRRISFQDTYQI